MLYTFVQLGVASPRVVQICLNMDKWLKELLCYALSNGQSLNMIHAWIIQYRVWHGHEFSIPLCSCMHPCSYGWKWNLESCIHGYHAVFGETNIIEAQCLIDNELSLGKECFALLLWFCVMKFNLSFDDIY